MEIIEWHSRNRVMKPKLQSSTFKINKIAPLKEKSANYFLLNRIYYRDQKTMQGKHYEHVAATLSKYIY